MVADHKKPTLQELRHSAAHLLAHAITELYPDTLLTIGPATDEGFFYDALPTKNFKEEDLAPIAKRMLELANQDIPLTHEQMPKAQARQLFANNRFKLELIDGIPGDTVGIARQGNFYDLCRGGHVASTGLLKHVALLTISGAYWRANKNDQPLQRISGVAFFTAQELQQYFDRIAQAQQRDHRRLGKQLDLFSFHDEGPGFAFFHPKGKTVMQVMIDHMRKLLQQYKYKEITTPTLLSAELWKQSGHYDFYKDTMFFSEADERSYAVKPMNCPGSILVYKERPRSYRELPLRLAEFGHVHRYELSGALHGLFRARAFTQDDGHIYCTKDQIEQEVLATVSMIKTILQRFEFHDVLVAISTRPAKAMGSIELWDHATQALKNALDHAHVKYEICEGDGAFYGPKIEFKIKDSMGRLWTCGTIQLDFVQPENFDLTYVTPAGTKERPVMIHRAIYGSLERFFAMLLEHLEGNLPFWLAPVQARVLTITDAQKPYARQIAEQLAEHNIRVEVEESSDPLAAQIKAAQLEKIPWMLVVGKKEVEQNTITLRYRDGKQEFGLSMEALLQKAKELA